MATPHELSTSTERATEATHERAGRNIDAWGDPNARRFLVGQGLYLTADSMTALTLASVLLVGSENTIEPRALITAVAFALIPYAIIGPLSGTLADRWNRRRALGGLSAIRAILIAGAAFATAMDSPAMVIVFAAPLMSAGRLFYMLRAASLPRIAPPGLLVRVDSCSLYTSILASGLGATIAAVGTIGGPVMVLSAAAAMQMMAGITLITLPISLGGGERDPEAGDWRSAARTFVTGRTRAVVAVTVAHRLFVGALFGTLLIVASHDFGLRDRAHLVGLVVTGVGSFIGTLTAPSLRFRLGIERLAIGAFALPAVLLSAVIGVGHTTTAGRIALGLAAVLTYFSFQNVRVATDAVVQTSTPDAGRAKLFSLYDAAYNVAYYGGGALAIVAGFHLRPTFGVMAIAALYATAALVLAASSNHLSPTPDPTPDRRPPKSPREPENPRETA